MADIEKHKDNDFFALSRIDRSLADNLKDIEKSFGEDAGIVTDFIVFISKIMKTDLFGYTRFTLSDFCRETGRNKQELCQVHPYFVNNPKAIAPEYYGHVYSTYFDYALFRMAQINIIFGKGQVITSQGKETTIEKYSILKDIKLNINRNSNAVKIYNIRVSDELLDGFLQRYYTIETNGYKLVGKGKNGSGRKHLFIFIYKTRHLLITQGQYITRLPLDYIASVCKIDVKEPKNRKTSVKRALEHIKEIGKIPFTYRFVQGDPTKAYQEEYWIELDFKLEHPILTLLEPRGDNLFFKHLVSTLKSHYNTKYPSLVISDEKDAFQRWLNNSTKDLDEKANIYISSYYKSYNKSLTIPQAKQMIISKFTKSAV